ncbi:MAG: hypothetical protein V4672_13450 [Verrucomicrobiota bacterium]
MKTKRSFLLHLGTLLALSLGMANQLSAQNVVSPKGIPVITSYVPAAAPAGHSVLANLEADSTTFGGAVIGEVRTVSHIQFRTSLGMAVSAPVTYVSPKLIRFTIPSTAITGPTTLVNGSLFNSRTQPSFSVVAFTQRPRGFTIINSAQWDVSSVKTGTTELLTGNTTLRTGAAHFFPRILTANRPLLLSVTFKNQPTTAIPSAPLFSVAESVAVRGTASGLTLVTHTELTLEPFTVAEILRMGATTGNARWQVLQRRLDRRMEVTPEGGVVLTQFTFPVNNSINPINLTIDEANAEFSQTRIRFSLKQGNRRSGEVITLYAPFNTFAATKLGPWEMEDELPPVVSPNIGAVPPSADDLQPSPMLVRRTN